MQKIFIYRWYGHTGRRVLKLSLFSLLYLFFPRVNFFVVKLGLFNFLMIEKFHEKYFGDFNSFFFFTHFAIYTNETADSARIIINLFCDSAQLFLFFWILFFFGGRKIFILHTERESEKKAFERHDDKRNTENETSSKWKKISLPLNFFFLSRLTNNSGSDNKTCTTERGKKRVWKKRAADISPAG